MVAGPLAQSRPRLAGCSGLPSNLRIVFVSLSTIGQQPARRFAVEAGGRNQPIVLLDALARPAARLDLDPVVPAAPAAGR